MASTDRLLAAAVGAAVTVVFVFLPFSSVLGGAVAGYLDGGDLRDGAVVGALSGLFAAVPALIWDLPSHLTGRSTDQIRFPNSAPTISDSYAGVDIAVFSIRYPARFAPSILHGVEEIQLIWYLITRGHSSYLQG